MECSPKDLGIDCNTQTSRQHENHQESHRMFGFRNRLLSLDDPRQLLLGAVAMERALAKERARCDRYFQLFSLIVLQFNKSTEFTVESQEKLIATFLEGRLRITDEKGYLRKGGIGVLLPMTDLAGAEVVLKHIRHFAESNGLSIESDVFPYHGHDGLAPFPDRDNRTEDDFDSSDSVGINNPDSEETETHSANSASPSAIVVETKKLRIDTPVRTDSVSHCTATEQRHRQLNELCSRPFPLWKRGIDLSSACIGMIIAAPLILLAAIAIKLTSKGPVFFKQWRAGQYGNPFLIYKLRTMVVDAEELKHLLQERNERDGPAFKIKHDPRVTRIGGFLRKTGLDELPQLLNVIRGDMSIVGPRPLPVGEENQCASWQQTRLDTKPGLTCTWQISKSRKISFRDWMRLDLRYGRQRGLLVDLGLMFRTIAAVLLGRVGH